MSRSGRRKAQATPLAAAGIPAAPGRGSPTALAVIEGAARTKQLTERVKAGAEQSFVVSSAVRRMAAASGGGAAEVPTRLTPRARRILQRGRELSARLRRVADGLSEVAGPKETGRGERLVPAFRQTVAMLELALQVVRTFPDGPTDQLTACEGLEGILAAVARRAAALDSTVRHDRQRVARLVKVAECLLRMNNGEPGAEQLESVARDIVADVSRGAPLDLFETVTAGGSVVEPDSPDAAAKMIARHSLITARVMARVVARDPDWAGRPQDAVLAALVHDVGMIRVEPSVVGRRGSLDDEARRKVEGHSRAGAAAVAQAFPGADWLVEVVAGHHERFDGTGYPAGKRGHEIPSLARLLSVCDVYAALLQDRPHRPAKDPRTALTDTLLFAEQGALDRDKAAWLLGLSFYPVGSAVELDDGSVGVVVATHTGRRDERTLARPVVALVADSKRRPYPAVRHIDLGEYEGTSVVRVLSSEERRELATEVAEIGATDAAAATAERL